MLERKLEVIFEEEMSKRLGIKKMKRQVEKGQTVDQVLFRIAYDLDLDINFHIAGNYIIDYASMGHLAITVDDNIMFIAVPTSISVNQAQALEEAKSEANGKNLYIYMLEHERLNTLYVQNENMTSNQNLINQVLEMVQITKKDTPKYKIK